MVYWQATARLPVMGTKEARLIADVLSGRSSADAMASLLAQSEGALQLFRRATDATAPCEWGLLLEDGPLVPLPHTAKMQVMARLALCKAHLLFAHHENHEALHWIIAVRKAARHVATDDLLVCTLTQFGMESMASTVTAAHVLGLSEIERKAHLHDLATLPPLRTIAQAMKGEHGFLDWTEHEFTHLDGAHIPKPTDDQAPTVPESAIVTADADMKALYDQLSKGTAREMIEQTRGYLKQAREACELPWTQGRPTLESLAQEIKLHGNALSRILVPDLVPARERELRLTTEAIMLRVALDQGNALQPGRIEKQTDALLGLPLLVKTEAGQLVISTQPDASMRAVTLKLGGLK